MREHRAGTDEGQGQNNVTQNVLFQGSEKRSVTARCLARCVSPVSARVWPASPVHGVLISPCVSTTYGTLPSSGNGKYLFRTLPVKVGTPTPCENPSWI